MRETDFEPGFPGDLIPTVQKCLSFVPYPLPPQPELAIDNAARNANERALLAVGELRAIIPSLPNPKLISEPFMRREAVLSSKIEGTNTEMEGLYLFETTQGDSDPEAGDTAETQDAREVANYVKALQYGLQSLESLPVCNRLLKEMHEKLLTGVKDHRGRHKSPGLFRKGQAYIGSNTIEKARYVAPPVSHLEDLMSKLETYINSPGTLPTLMNLAVIHYQFEAIHPFADGNGRLGRLLISLLLCAADILPEPLLYLSAYFERNREEYNQRMWEISRRGAWMEWVMFFLEGVRGESQDACERARTLLALREEYRESLQSDGSAGSLIALTDSLFQWPAISVNTAKDTLSMSYQGAKNNVDKLLERGILEEATGNYRNKVYLARPIIKLMS